MPEEIKAILILLVLAVLAAAVQIARNAAERDGKWHTTDGGKMRRFDGKWSYRNMTDDEIDDRHW